MIKDKSLQRNPLLRLMLDESLYYLAFSFYFIIGALEHTTFTEFLFIPVDILQSVLQVAVLMLLLLKFGMQRASFKGWLIATALVLLGFLSWRQSGEGWLFWVALFVVCSHGVRLRPLAWLSFSLSLVTVATAMAFAGAGIIENVVTTRAGVTRYAMGFSHANFLGLYLLIACMSFSVLRFGKNPLPDLALIGVADAINLATADSRTTVLLSALQAALLVTFYVLRSETARRRARFCFGAVVFLAVALSIYFMVFFDASSAWQAALNDFLSGRLNLAHRYFLMQPLTLLGSDFSGYAPIYWENGKTYAFVVDNAWCHLILRFGVLPAFAFITGYGLLLLRMLRGKRWDALLFGIVLMAVYGFSETLGVRFECNYFLFALGAELLYISPVAKELSRPSEERDAVRKKGSVVPRA